MKNPNGYGSIEKLPGKRRRPYRVRITQKFILEDNKAKQIRKTLGYFSTKTEAVKALAEYNTNPFDLDAEKTLAELYEIWSEKKYNQISASGVKSYKASWKYLSQIHDMSIREIKTSHIQGCIDECSKSYSIKSNMKNICKEIMSECLANDLIRQNYAELVKLGKKEKAEERVPFCKEDIDLLWSMQGDLTADILLILLYTGLRINELLSLKKENVNLSEKIINISESKTDAGIRIVPLHARICPLIEFYYNKATIYLIETKNANKVEYANFTSRNISEINSILSHEHKCHDTRVTFISRWKELDLDALYLKKIVGHQPGNVTDKIYTKIKNDTLAAEINKLEY